ncbi:MAG: ABC transporter permease [Clostridiales bacterium]|nr:ABC transporter permease [Clostridiales bacterium]
MLAVYEKELKGYFRSPIGAVFMGLFLMVSAGIFIFLYLKDGLVAYSAYLSYVNIVFMITIPILTMRTLSEEKKLKTDQLLLTNPLKVSDIVIGKFLAAATVFLVTLVIHSLNAVIVSFFSDNMAFSEIIVSYLGLFLVGCSFIAIGVFVSSLTESQVVSAIITFAVLLFLFIVSWMQSSLPSSPLSGVIFTLVVAAAIAIFLYATMKNAVAAVVTFAGLGLIIGVIAIININLYAGLLNSVVNWFSVLAKFDEYITGLVSLSSFVYLLSFTAVFIYLTVYQLEKRRWA